MPPDELVVLIESPPRSVDPRSTTVSYDFKLSNLVYARLVSVDDPELEPRLELAERVDEVPAGAPGPGRHRYDITLRQARFSDGSPVTAADVAYTIAAVLDPKTGHPVLRRRFGDAGIVLPVEVRGPRAVRIAFQRPQASYLTDLDFGVMKAGSIERAERGEIPAPIGAGAFVLDGPAGETSRFVRNEHYFGGRPPMRRLTIRTVRDANSRLLSLVGGSADLVQNSVSPLLYDAIRRWDRRLEIVTGPSAIFFYLGLNQKDARLGDVRVRRALMMAIDRQRIVDTKLRGKAKLATGMLPTFHWAYNGEVQRYPRDLAGARRLLDEAGVRDPDGPGPEPRLRLTYKTSTDTLPVSIARVVAAQLAEVGIEVEVRPYEFHVFLNDVKKGNYQIYGLQTGEVAEPNLLKRFFHSSFIPTDKDPNAGHNRMRYRNPEMDTLLDAGERELDRGRRRQIYARVQRLLAEDLPMLPMWHIDNVVVTRRQVQGYSLLPSAQLTGLARVWKRP